MAAKYGRSMLAGQSVCSTNRCSTLTKSWVRMLVLTLHSAAGLLETPDPVPHVLVMSLSSTWRGGGARSAEEIVWQKCPGV